jgi:TetR/AcrR family transcriptional regulator
VNAPAADDADRSATTHASEKRQLRIEQRSQAMRVEIIEAAMKLLERPGYPALTVEDIAEEAAVSTATLYRYFPGGKPELRRMLVGEALRIDQETLDPAFESTKAPVDKLSDIGWAYLGFGLKYPGYFQVVAQPERFGFEGDEVTLIANRVSELVERVAVIIEQGQGLRDASRFPDRGLGPRDIAEVLHGAWNGLIGLSLRNDGLARQGTELERLASVATLIVRRGLLSDPRHDQDPPHDQDP